MKKYLLALFLALCLLLVGCSKTDPMETRPPDIEPTATYDWMAGESPVPTKRMGVAHCGGGAIVNAVSASGTYLIERANADPWQTYIWYADHGSDTLVKLCGRADCTHDSEDCNAFLFYATALSYYDGYLYAVYGMVDTSLPGGSGKDGCGLVRMDPDGSNHMEILDLRAFAKSLGGEYVQFPVITDGVLTAVIGYWELVPDEDDPGEMKSVSVDIGTYYYKLDGSMEEPMRITEEMTGRILYNSGGIIQCTGEAQQGGENGGRWAWDPDTNTVSYLADSLNLGNVPFFGKEAVYFFRDGGIWQKTYADNRETLLAETGLEGKYILNAYPDCLVLASEEQREEPDRNLYFYNWAFELIDTIELNYPINGFTSFAIGAETAERFILTDKMFGSAKYYINKSELGTGSVEIHSFEQVGEIQD